MGQARAPLVVQGLAAAAAGLVLLAAALLGWAVLLLAVVALSLLLALGVLALLDAPQSAGALVLLVVATAASAAVVIIGDGSVEGLAGVVALSLVAALVHQLSRGTRRIAVTESLADTLFAVVLVVSAACLVALARLAEGRQVVVVALAGAAAGLLLGRVGDSLSARPELSPGATRGLPGLLLGLAAGAGAGAVVALAYDGVQASQGALLGLAAAAAAACADLAVDLAAAELPRARSGARRTSALRPVGVLLPYAVLGPVALVTGRLVLG